MNAATKNNSPVIVDLLGGFLKSFVPQGGDPTRYGARYLDSGVHAVNITIGLYSHNVTDVLKDVFYAMNIVREASKHVVLVRKAADVKDAASAGKVGLILGIQGFDFLGDATWQVPILSELGLRVATLTYNERNQIGNGCMERVDDGLTVVGRRVVREFARSNVLLDLSHAGLRTSLEAIDVYGLPVVFSHSNCNSITPNPRNITDEQIKAAAKSGGLIGISSYSPFCHDPKKPRPNLDDVLNHIDYACELVGVDHVAIGTDLSPHSKIKWENATRRMYPEMVGPYIFETLYAEGFDSHKGFLNLPGSTRQTRLQTG